MPIYDPEGAYLAYAIGIDVDTTFRNADALFDATEIQPTDLIDTLQTISIDYTDPQTEESSEMSSSQYRTRRTTGKRVGRIVLPMFLQTGWPLFVTLGTCVTTRTGKETTTVVCTTGATMVDGSYFLINCVDGAGATVKNYVWFNMGGDADPTPAGYTEIQVDYVEGDTAAQVAGKLQAVMDVANYYDSTSDGATCTIVTANNGAVEDATDFDTTLTITVTVQGASTHAISLNASQTPVYLGFHFEKEMTDEDVRYDFLGYMPDYWRLYCSEDNMPAKQELAANFAYTKGTATNLAEPSKLTLENYGWDDLKHASGALTIKYNGTVLDFDIRGFDLMVPRTKPLWGVKGASKMPTEAFVSGVGIEYLLEGYLTGINVRTLMATEPESYVGTGLVGVIKFYKDTNNEYGITLSDLYLVPDATVLNEVDWYERKTLRFVSRTSSTTIVGSVEDRQDKTYYEND